MGLRRTLPLSRIAIGIVAVLAFARTVDAELVEPSRGGDDFATTLQQDPEFGGTVEASQVIPFDLAEAHGERLVGELLNEVVRDPHDNTLSFYYSVLNTPVNQTLYMFDVNANDFRGQQTQVGMLTDSPGNGGPNEVLRSGDGAIIHFIFLSDLVLPPGARTNSFLIKTAATAFDDHGSTLVFAIGRETGQPDKTAGETTTVSSTFRPVSSPPPVVPLPPAWTGIAMFPLVIIAAKRWHARSCPA